MAAAQADGVRAVAETAAAAAGLVVEDVTISRAGRRRVVRVVVDLPQDHLGGVPLDAVTEASQALSAALDAGSVLGQQPYVLEVTSPGVDRPLTQRRHWSRARGRKVAVVLADGGSVTGRLGVVDGEGIELVVEGAGPLRLDWGAVTRGRVEVEFAAVDDEDAPALDDRQERGDDRSSSRGRR